MRLRRTRLWIAVTGLLLLLPGLVFQLSSPLTRDDAAVALTDLVRIPLDELHQARSAGVIVRIPNSSQWVRIRSHWGDPTYVLAARDPERRLLYCWSRLRLDISAGQAHREIALAADGGPYGYSTECEVTGLGFHAAPGSDVTVRVRVSEEIRLPPGELILTPAWAGTKDKLVGIELDEEIWKVLRVSTVAGMILCAAAACLSSRRRA